MHLQRQVKHKAKSISVSDQIINPVQELPNIATKDFYIKVEITGLIAVDQTGKYPTTSKRGHKYLFILYSYDANAILFCPMKNKTASEFLRVYDNLIAYLQQRGITPTMHCLDNEKSDAYINAIVHHNIAY